MGRKKRSSQTQQKEFIKPSAEALVGNFEEWEVITESIKDLGDQKKAKTKELSDDISGYAQEIGCSPKDLRSAYKYWSSLKKTGDENSGVQFELMALVDLQVQKETEEA